MNNEEVKIRPRVGIIIDYTIRIPDFTTCYNKFKEMVLIGLKGESDLYFGKRVSKKKKQEIVELKQQATNFFDTLEKTDSKAYDFYLHIPNFTNTIPVDFDITYKKYFYNNEHRLKFLESWSFNLYGQGTPINRSDLHVLNTAHSQLCEIILIDRITTIRKIPNTYTYLGRCGLYAQELHFCYNEEELNKIKETLTYYWDPFMNQDQVMLSFEDFTKSTPKFLDWFKEIEKEIQEKIV